MKAGQYEEASGLYRKVYNLGLSVESQASSALGAGRCFHEMGNSEETARWLNRYVTLVRDQGRPEFHSACLLLGKAYLAQHKPQQAHAALNLAIKGNLSREQYVETVAVLVRAYIEQGLLLVQILRSIGLVNKAIALLQEKGQFLPSPELKGAVALELAACYYDNDDIESARKTLSDAFALVGPGPQAQQIGRELARMCLRLGQMNQAISVCSQLLEHASARERPPVLTLLAEAHRRQGQYDRAMAAVLNQYDNTTDPNLVRVAPDAKLAP
jgi:tetratricopeptide (TPR) repeat protein